MALEIEVKARVDEPELLKTRLSAFGKADCSYEKEDTYWFPLAEKAVSGNGPALPPSGLRVRRENNGPFGTAPAEQRQTTLVTYKIREPPGADGIEVNQEREFTVSDAGVFEELLGRLGLAPGIGKHKQGWAWNCAGKDGDVIRAELSEVRGLGWFIEL
ncbi:MAG: CYTH domain-containing protein, partial [Treponema sp.]|nr:CYTH domain-containing protein [Treponema sp.]